MAHTFAAHCRPRIRALPRGGGDSATTTGASAPAKETAKMNWKVALPLLAAASLAVPVLGAGKAKTVEIRGAKSTKAAPRQPDNSKPVPKSMAPAAKGGPKARGLVGTLHVDNRTGYYITIYVNGDSVGTVGPY